MNKILYALKSLLTRNSMESAMREEMQLHIELQATEFESQGMSAAEALRNARRAFGNQTHIQEDCRASWGVRWMDELSSDIRFASKQLRKYPLFTIVAVLSLGVGIGINLSLLNAYNTLLFKPLAFDHPEQLRELHTVTPVFNGYTSGRVIRNPDGSVQSNAISYPVYRQFKKDAESLADVFCWTPTYSFVVEIQNTKRTDHGLLVSNNYFESLQVRPLVGRRTLNDAQNDDSSRSTWISESVWERDFEKNPEVIGKTVTIANSVFVIIGVIPDGKGGLEKGDAPDFFFPIKALPVFNNFHELHSSEHFFLQCGVRLKNELFAHDVQALLSETLRNAGIPYQKETSSITPEVWLFDASRGIESQLYNQSRSLVVPMILSGVLLLVSCINLGGLQFSRNYKRIRELNIRAALGAGRSRLIRQLLTETLILCLAGSIHGIILTLIGYQWLNTQFVNGIQQMDSSPDFNSFALLAGIITLTTVLVGLYPAVHVTRFRHNLHTNQKSGNTAQSFRVGKFATTLQIICAISLIYTAFLFSKTLINLSHKDLGFDHSNLLLFSFEGEEYQESTSSDNEVLQLIKSIPGVENAACANLQMLSNWTSSTTISMSQFQPDSTDELRTYRMEVSPDFFKTLNIPIIRGKGFDPEHLASNTNKVIVSRSFAAKAFSKGNPIGKTFNSNSTDWTIIGVCEDIHYHSLRQESDYLCYSPISEAGYLSVIRSKFYYIHSRISAAQMAKTIEKTMTQNFPSRYLGEVKTLDSNIRHLTANERKISTLSLLFSGFSVLLACIGLFAQMSFETASRNHEIGVRLALGANPKRILRHLLNRGLAPLLPGLLIGVPLALTVKHFLGERLYGVSTIEFSGLILSSILIVATTLLAVSIPSFRSSRLDPVKVLKNE